MGYRILRDATAFSNAPARGQRRPRKTDDAHLKWLRTLPCVVTGKRPVEAAHIRYADPSYGKRLTGGGEKPDDRWALPLSPEMHRAQHDMNERAFWDKYNIDPCKIALALFAVSQDDEQGELIIRTIARKHSHDAE